jgi:hypothetical protein
MVESGHYYCCRPVTIPVVIAVAVPVAIAVAIPVAIAVAVAVVVSAAFAIPVSDNRGCTTEAAKMLFYLITYHMILYIPRRGVNNFQEYDTLYVRL